MSEDKEQAREAFARLLDAELREQGVSREELARRVAPSISRGAIFSWLRTDGRFPQPAKRAELEDVLRWVPGTIDRILERPGEAIFWNLGRVHKPDPGMVPVARASELSTDELLMELNRRVGSLVADNAALTAELDLYRQPSNVIGLEASENGASDASRVAEVHEFKPRHKSPVQHAARTKMPDEDPKNDTE